MKKLLFLFLMFTTSMSLTSFAQVSKATVTSMINTAIDPLNKSILSLQSADKVKTQTISDLQAQVKNLIADTAAKGIRIAILEKFKIDQEALNNNEFFPASNKAESNRKRIDSLESKTVLIKPDGSDGNIVGPDGFLKAQYYFNYVTGKMERRY